MHWGINQEKLLHIAHFHQPYDAIEKADSYTLKLYAPNQTTPSAVIECKKMPSQTTPQAGQPRTYVGEIVKLLMKK